MSRVRMLVGACGAGLIAGAAGLFLAEPVGAQFGATGFGGRGTDGTVFEPAGTQLAGRDRVIISANLIVAVSENGDAVYGYSPVKGEWKRQELKGTGKERPAPVVGFHLASVRVGQRIYAFSGRTATWDTLELDDGVEARDPSFQFETILVDSEAGLHVFSADSGRWASIDLPRETGRKD